MEDLAFLKENVDSINEMIRCDILIQILEDFFDK